MLEQKIVVFASQTQVGVITAITHRVVDSSEKLGWRQSGSCRYMIYKRLTDARSNVQNVVPLSGKQIFRPKSWIKQEDVGFHGLLFVTG
jgi:hypothetical protein